MPAAATLGAPALRLMLARRLRRGREIAGRLAERWGRTPRRARRAGWCGCMPPASARPCRCCRWWRRWRGRGAEVLMTTGTVTSAALLDERLPAMGLDGCVRHRFVPLDVPAWVARFLDHWRPDVAGFVESEVWPNLIAACRRRAIPIHAGQCAALARALRPLASRAGAGARRCSAASTAPRRSPRRCRARCARSGSATRARPAT